MDAAPDEGSDDQERVTHRAGGAGVDEVPVISQGVPGTGGAASPGARVHPLDPGADADPVTPGPPDAAAPAGAPRDTDPTGPRGPDRTRRLLIVGAAVLAVLGVALVGWALVHQTGAPPTPTPTPTTAGAAGPGGAAATGPPPPSSLGAPPPGRVVEPAEPFGVSSPPVTLTVPAIRVASPVDQVGLNPDRTMEVPAEGSPGYDHAAWFRYSVTPGRQGPSVIIGHVDSAAAGPSVFFELGRLRPGDRAEVTRADGATVTFEVTEIAAYPKDAFPTDRVYGPTPGPELRLITCGGSFDRSAGSYRDNTVVFAREVSPG